MKENVVIESKIPTIDITIFPPKGTSQVIIRYCDNAPVIDTTSSFLHIDIKDLIESFDIVLTEDENMLIYSTLTYCIKASNNNDIVELNMSSKKLTAKDKTRNEEVISRARAAIDYEKYLHSLEKYIGDGYVAAIHSYVRLNYYHLLKYTGNLKTGYNKNIKQFTMLEKEQKCSNIDKVIIGSKKPFITITIANVDNNKIIRVVVKTRKSGIGVNYIADLNLINGNEVLDIIYNDIYTPLSEHIDIDVKDNKLLPDKALNSHDFISELEDVMTMCLKLIKEEKEIVVLNIL